MTGTRESRLGRWSRRKRAAAAEDTGPTDAGLPVEAAPDGSFQEPENDLRTEAEVLEELGLPDPDGLQMGDDFKRFLQAGVPAALRRRALRRLWLSNPALANLDGLVDYGEDFTDAALVPEVLETAYKVGRGFLKELVEADDDDEDDEDDEGTTAEVTAGAEDSPGTPKISPAPVPDPEPALSPAREPQPPEPVAQDLPPRPRRMSFRRD